jgi:Fic family protein
MQRGLQGKYVTTTTVGEKVEAFVPAPLPPSPAIDWTPELECKFEQASLLLGRLDGISALLPDTGLFLYMYVRKEALLSSMIEGTQSSLSDLLLYEMNQTPKSPLEDVRMVSNYVAALFHGIKLMEDGLPLSLRLLREIHRVLLRSGRGSNQMPGEFRHSQNWIGGTRPGNARFVPPPVEEAMECMYKLELFLHDQPVQTSTLVKAALAHVQFETIHPFLDGNGRLGRLLITLILYNERTLRHPMLYLSLYFKTHRQYYYELLNNVRLTGDWEAWLDFFADAVIATASQAVDVAQQIHEMTKQDIAKISGLGRGMTTALAVHRVLLECPMVTTGYLMEKTGITAVPIRKSLECLERMGIVTEISGKKRGKVFSHARYLEIMTKGTELPDEQDAL